MRYWFGWMMLAAGLPCWLMGFAMDLQVTAMLSKLSASKAFAEGTQRTAEWVQSTYWLGPFLLWIGGALALVGCVLGIIELTWRRSDDNVDTSHNGDRFLNP